MHILRLNSLLIKPETAALLNQLALHDKASLDHSLRVGLHMSHIVDIMNMNETAKCEWVLAAVLHDIGKLSVPNSILCKDCKLNEFEYNIVKQHAAFGYELISMFDYSDLVRDGVYYHHEQLDGHGYPNGIKDDQIPDVAKMISILDAHDAMCFDRPYHKGYPKILVQRELSAFTGVRYHENYVNFYRQVTT